MVNYLSLLYKVYLFLFVTALSTNGIIGQNLHFAHVTDTHVGGKSGAEDLIKTVADLNTQPDLDFVLVTGDITEFGSDDELRQASEILKKLHIPCYVLPGNHDSKWSESGNNSFVTIFGAECFSFEKNGVLFIGTASGPNMRMAPGLVPREQIVFLDSVLNHRINPSIPVIFVNHYPLDESLSNWGKVVDLLKTSNIRATLLGHGHTNRLFHFEDIPGIMGRANLESAKTEAGYNLVSIENDTIYYRERRAAGKTLECWCKVPFHKKTNPPIGAKPSRQMALQQTKRHSGDSLHLSFPKTETLWCIQENSDIGTGITVHGKQAVYATTAGEIVSIELNSGRRIWSYHTGGKIYSTPAVEGNLVVCASTDHNIYCLDLKTGRQKWMHPTIKPIVASPAISEGAVYIGSSDGSFRCLSLADGNLVWSFDSVKNFVECKPLLLKSSVCFGSWGNTFYSLDKKSGTLLWKREKYTNRMLSPAAVWPVAADGKIFLVAPDRHMTALDEYTGAEIWDSGKYSCRESIGLSRDGKQVYIMNMTEGNVDAFFTSSNHQTLAWECQADLGYEIAPSPIVESGRFVFIPSATGIVTAIDRKTHQVAWKHKVSDALINSVLPVGKDKLLISAMDGKVVCLSF